MAAQDEKPKVSGKLVLQERDKVWIRAAHRFEFIATDAQWVTHAFAVDPSNVLEVNRLRPNGQGRPDDTYLEGCDITLTPH